MLPAVPLNVLKVGDTPVPLLVNTCSALPTAVTPTGLAAFPNKIPLSVNVVTPVPPLGTAIVVAKELHVPDIILPRVVILFCPMLV